MSTRSVNRVRLGSCLKPPAGTTVGFYSMLARLAL
jgi:hypothetical protein